MEALVVTFKTHASQEQFTAATAEHAPVFAELDGLLAKRRSGSPTPKAAPTGESTSSVTAPPSTPTSRAISSRASSRSRASKARAGAATRCSMS